MMWKDGVGYGTQDNPPYSAGNGTGSIIGHAAPPFVELEIVHGGSQSMPYFYDNSGAATYSEVEVDISELGIGPDWTKAGIKSLSLYIYGATGNTGQLYIKINGTKAAIYDGDSGDIARAMWWPWNIDLSTVGGNLSNVTSLTIGIEGAGAAGIVYIDDIRLYPLVPERITPAEPDAANLVAHYDFEGNASDSSGNGFNGVEIGPLSYGAGVDGQALKLKLQGVINYVAVESVGITGAAPRTISGWAKADMINIPAWTNVFGFTGAATSGQHFDIEVVGDTGTTTLGYYGVHRYGWERDIIPIDLEWHHLAAIYEGAMVTWYGDGQLIGSAEVDPAGVDTPGPVHIGKRQDNENIFPGMIDEVRIYDVALSDGEIAWLAGRTEPLHKPF